MKIAVILAAGIGTRLHPLTFDKPKCMITVAGQPILEHQLRAYEKAGFGKVYVIGGFRADAIKAWLATRSGTLAIELIENREFDVTNNMFSLFLLRDKMQGRPFFLSNGDVVFDSAALNLFKDTDADGSAIFIDKSIFNEESMKIVVDASDHVRGISKRYTKSEAFAVSIDLYRFSADGSQRLFQEMDRIIVQKGERNQWTEVALDHVLQAGGYDFRPIDLGGLPWVEVDNMADLAQADLLFCPQRPQIAKAKIFVFDIDGTLSIDGNFLPHSIDIVKRLQKERKVFFCSNNSSRSRQEYAGLLQSKDIFCRSEDVISSVGATISFLRNHRIQSIFLLGTPSLKGELEAAGFRCSAKNPEMVVVGFDKTLTYEAAAEATSLIARGCPYILTHPDPACPTTSGPVPDAGAIGAMLQTATGIDPLAILGKPSPAMLQPLFDKLGLAKDQAVMIGDRLTTDIHMANRVGCLSVLVLSGITSRLEAEQSPIKPSLLIDHVGKLSDII